MNATVLHPNLPDLPARIQRLPVDSRGFPVPWFVAWIDGVPDFRVIGPGKIYEAINDERCWVCGDQMGSFLAFTIGPMCAINRISAEPPSHRECAIFAAKACPFLTKPAVERREENLPAKVRSNPNHIPRNPGAILVWITKTYRITSNDDGSPLFKVGDPLETLWFAHGRNATRNEVIESIDSGLPTLFAAIDNAPVTETQKENERKHLREQHLAAFKLLPAA